MGNKTIGIVGLGFMGRSMAACLLHRGMHVVAFTQPASDYPKARQAIAEGIEDLIAHRAAEPALRQQWATRYTEAKSIADMDRCEFIVETISENMEAKRALYAELESAVKQDIPIASNTSGLPITLLQQGLRHPERFIGMHWCGPCYVNPLLEVIPGEKTNQETIDATMRLAVAAGKAPGLVRKDIEGFILNRLHYALFREALHLLDAGIGDAATIDRMFQSVIGMYANVMGPLRWMDLTGFTIYPDVIKRLFPTLDNSATVPKSLQQLIDSGARGAAQGRGFYSYTPEEERQFQKLIAENAWNMLRLREQYAKNFPEIK